MASRLNWAMRAGGGTKGEEKRQGQEKEKNQKESVVKKAVFYMKEKLGEGKQS